MPNSKCEHFFMGSNKVPRRCLQCGQYDDQSDNKTMEKLMEILTEENHDTNRD